MVAPDPHAEEHYTAMDGEAPWVLCPTLPNDPISYKISYKGTTRVAS